jgi:hypothetical protein
MLVGFEQKDCTYQATIFSQGREKLLFKGASQHGIYPFTPPQSGNYMIELEGINGDGEYSFSQQSLTSNALLTSDKNVIGRNDYVSGRIADGAIATYRFSGEKNSPCILTFQGNGVQYYAVVTDQSGKKYFEKGSTSIGSYPFTPPETGSYLLTLKGTSNYGDYTIGLDDKKDE